MVVGAGNMAPRSSRSALTTGTAVGIGVWTVGSTTALLFVLAGTLQYGFTRE